MADHPQAEDRRPRTLSAAARLLAERDRVMARLVDAYGLPRLSKPADTHFAALVRSIVYQQLAGAAASAIHGRLVAALAGTSRPSRCSPWRPRRCGPRACRATRRRRCATWPPRCATARWCSTRDGWPARATTRWSTRLSTVRGIGRWTAEMFLMFQLRRLDVWPTGDLGVRKGYGLAWGIPMPSAGSSSRSATPSGPIVRVVAWYCWRAAEQPGQAASPVTG